MSCVQATVYNPLVGLVVQRPSLKVRGTFTSVSFAKNSVCPSASRSLKLQQHQAGLRLSSTNHTRFAPLYASSSNENTQNEDEDYFMESLSKAMADINRENSIQGRLKKQWTNIAKGGPWGGGRGGGGSGGSGNGGSSEGDSFKDKWDEALQVFLATTALIMVYIYIIRGEELSRLFRDYVTYKSTGRCTLRLERAMAKWARFWRPIMRSVAPVQHFLESVIAWVKTWLHDPEDKQVLQKLLQSSQARRRGAENY